MCYADDTILGSENANILQIYIQAIETESETYRLKLNKNKCEQISVNISASTKTKFKDGSNIKSLEEVKYLSCMINDKGDPRREARKRISECMRTFKRLDNFWKT